MESVKASKLYTFSLQEKLCETDRRNQSSYGLKYPGQDGQRAGAPGHSRNVLGPWSVSLRKEGAGGWRNATQEPHCAEPRKHSTHLCWRNERWPSPRGTTQKRPLFHVNPQKGKKILHGWKRWLRSKQRMKYAKHRLSLGSSLLISQVAQFLNLSFLISKLGIIIGQLRGLNKKIHIKLLSAGSDRQPGCPCWGQDQLQIQQTGPLTPLR